MTDSVAPLKLPAPRPASAALPRSGLLQRQCACGGTPGPSGECAACRARRLGVQRQAAGPGLATAPPIVDEVLRSSGQPLDTGTRAFMESRFGHDFSTVRIHADAQAGESARAINARAYTVGSHVAFAAGQFAPGTIHGQRLIAHELAHTVQQAGGALALQPWSIGARDHPAEREADRAANAVLAGNAVPSQPAVRPGIVQRAAGDLVGYTGGQSGSLVVIRGGSPIGITSAVSGHPGTKEHEVNAGPIPTGTYTLHPDVTRPTVATSQAGVCGAAAIASGYQEITNNDPSPCDDPTSHYCTVACATPADPGRRCFTPRDCWGAKRMRIEGSIAVAKPAGGKVTRGGFYIHGGNHSVGVTSGCVKVADDIAFTHLRTLKGTVPLCVGAACPPSVGTTAAVSKAVGAAAEAAGSAIQQVLDIF